MERLTYTASCDGYKDVGLNDGVTVGDAICELADYEDEKERTNKMAQMTAIEYLKILARANDKCSDCEKCPISFDNNGRGECCTNYQIRYPEEAIAAVEQWTKEHPLKTRADVFFERYPEADERDDNMLPAIDPCKMGFVVAGGDACNRGSCADCYKKYWLAPAEEDGK